MCDSNNCTILTLPKIPKSTKPGEPSFRKPNLPPILRDSKRWRVKVAQKEQNSCNSSGTHKRNDCSLEHCGCTMTYCSPGEGLVPEGRSFLQTKQYPTNGSPKGSCHSSSSSTRHKVTLVSVYTHTTRVIQL